MTETAPPAHGWDERPLASLLRRPPRYGINAAAVPIGARTRTYLRITDISADGRFTPAPRVGVRHPRAADYLMAEGELVFARTGASVGKSYLYDSDDGELVYAGFLINIAPEPDVLLPQFLAYFAQTKRYWDWVVRTSVRSGQPGINGQEYGQLLVPVPEISEQREIVAILKDADHLISSLEALISKREDLRVAIAQGLLSGRSRLPGYDANWTERSLADMGTFLKGRGIKRDDVRAEGVPCIRYGEIYTTFRDYTDTPISRVSSAVADTAMPLRPRDLLFAASGETREEIGKCVAYTGDGPAVAGGDIVILRLRSGDPVFLGALMNSAQVVSQKARLGQGDAVVHISSTALAGVSIFVPDDVEQAAIGRVILDADEEIAMLRRRLEKAKGVKAGLLQQLMAGPVRHASAELEVVA